MAPIRSTGLKRLMFLLACAFLYFMVVYYQSPLVDRHPKSQLEIAKTHRIHDVVDMNTTSAVLPDEDTVILEPSPGKKCMDKGARQYLLFMFISSPENLQARNVIRGVMKEQVPQWDATIVETNPSFKRNETIRAIFLVGKPTNGATDMDALKAEGETNGDLIIDDFQEAYLNLTVKTLRMLKWVQSHCPDVRYTVKIDDDVFVNVPLLLKLLKKYDTSGGQDLIAGHKYTAINVDSNPNSKWFTPRSLWKNKLPNFVGGFFYLLGARVRANLYQGSLKTPLFHLEDVFLTGIVRERFLDMDVVDFPVYVQWPFTQAFMPACKVSQEVAVIHSLTPEKIKCYMQFTVGEKNCVLPFLLPMFVFC